VPQLPAARSHDNGSYPRLAPVLTPPFAWVGTCAASSLRSGSGTRIPRQRSHVRAGSWLQRLAAGPWGLAKSRVGVGRYYDPASRESRVAYVSPPRYCPGQSIRLLLWSGTFDELHHAGAAHPRVQDAVSAN
jgi:hypothetical protein